MGALCGRTGGFGRGRRLGAALAAAAVLALAGPMSGTAAADEVLKPRFGDIPGILYKNIAGYREDCLKVIEARIQSCGQNTEFDFDRENRQYAGCLPIFRRQAQDCVEHFLIQRSRCQDSGRVHIPDFIFGCRETKTAAGEGAPQRGSGRAPGGGGGTATGSGGGGSVAAGRRTAGGTGGAAAGRGAGISVTELRPKLGDIPGLYYPDVSGRREDCLAALESRIDRCRENTTFASARMNRDYAGCLPLFREQARRCVGHFTRSKRLCDGSSWVRISEFRISCEATEKVVGEDAAPQQPGAAPEGRRMAARTRVNLRAGPGTNYRIVGGLAAGQAVTVTGRTGDWLRIAGPGGGAAFVHGRYMAGAAGRGTQGGGPAAHLSPKCPGMAEGAACWVELANKPGCHWFDTHYVPGQTFTWSGACAGGVAVGRGTLRWQVSDGSVDTTGTLVRGKRHGRWVTRGSGGWVQEGSYVDGKAHGRWVTRGSGGWVQEGSYVDGKKHGRWVFRFAGGDRLEFEYRNGSRDGQPGIYITKGGRRTPGRWAGDCFRDDDGNSLVSKGRREKCTSR